MARAALLLVLLALAAAAAAGAAPRVRLALPPSQIAVARADAAVEAVGGATSDEERAAAAANGWVLYKQCDGAWGSQRLGTCGDTICSAGCAMTSTAMVLRTRGTAVDPSSLNSWLTSHGGYVGGCDIVWSSVNAFGSVSFQGIEHADFGTICAGIAAGHGVIANVNGGGHWVLLTGCQGSDTFTVNDPGYSRSTYSYGEVVQEAVYH